ncbi:MAG TPA: AMP-binding protein [Gammaproteobacteria bacterium]|nr:AMP-binding protein [Gammaproteobacteria bacterium]
MRPPGNVPTAHADTFVRDRLSPRELWPEFDYSAAHLRGYPDRYNAATLLDRAATGDARDRTAFVYEGVRWPYALLRDRVERLVRVLDRRYHLVPGERVLIRGGNSPMAAVCWLAVLKAGGVCVTTSPLLRADDIRYVIDKAAVRLALCELDLAEELELARARAQRPKDVGYYTPLGCSPAEAEIDRRIESAPREAGSVATAADDPALITFTSGTTGEPKGAVHFHRDILAVSDCWPQRYTVRPDDVVCGSSSFAFTYGLAASLIFPLRYGATSVLIAGRPTPEAILEAVVRHKVTSLYAVPTVFHAMLERIPDSDISSLRKCSSAGEHLPQGLWQDWLDATGIRIVNGLGASEMLSHFLSEFESVNCPGSMGHPVPGYRAVLLDGNGEPVPRGEQGRLAVRGPTGVRYIDDPAQQKSAVLSGWNLTGDICEQDPEGCFWYVSRADDMIISSGYNVSPREVEQCLIEHPWVDQCAVVGLPDAARGNVVCACVVPRRGVAGDAATASALQEFAKQRTAPYKYPRAVRFFEALPMTATGKIQRGRLRELLAAELRAAPGGEYGL